MLVADHNLGYDASILATALERLCGPTDSTVFGHLLPLAPRWRLRASNFQVPWLRAMSNPSPVPAPGMDRSHRSKAEVQDAKTEVEGLDASSGASKVSPVSTAGPRKLIRPSLPARALGSRPTPRRNGLSSAALSYSSLEPAALPKKNLHAENFYLQKQAQAQTLMVIVLEDGEQIEGYIEWYDLNSIKVRHGSRTLIYKSSIKYLYKAGEAFRV
jgi:sRNA-binding regulator protein Hfq